MCHDFPIYGKTLKWGQFPIKISNTWDKKIELTTKIEHKIKNLASILSRNKRPPTLCEARTSDP